MAIDLVNEKLGVKYRTSLTYLLTVASLTALVLETSVCNASFCVAVWTPSWFHSEAALVPVKMLLSVSGIDVLT